MTELHVDSLSSPYPQSLRSEWWREPARWLQVDIEAEHSVASQPVAPLLTGTSHYCGSHWWLSCSPLLTTLTAQFRWPWSHSRIPIPSWLSFVFNGLGPISFTVTYLPQPNSLAPRETSSKILDSHAPLPQREGQHLYSLMGPQQRSELPVEVPSTWAEENPPRSTQNYAQ